MGEFNAREHIFDSQIAQWRGYFGKTQPKYCTIWQKSATPDARQKEYEERLDKELRSIEEVRNYVDKNHSWISV